MNSLKQLKKRIKGARLWQHPKSGRSRLYIKYGRKFRGVKTNAWFEVVNDRIQPFVKVENPRSENYYDDELASRYEDEIHAKFYELIYDCEKERQEIPLHERLKDDLVPVHENSMLHQAQALRFCCSMKVSALFADTGTGKTKIAVDLANSRYEARQIKKAIVFCPVSTKQNLKDEIDKWSSDNGLVWRIEGHETISQSDATYLEVLEWMDSNTMVIVDESHFCKTPTAKRSKRILKCADKTSYKLIMTGTPTENVRDLYMQYAILSKLITGCKNWIEFEDEYLILGGINNDEIIGHKNIDYLMGLFEPYTYQIKKRDCLDLPSKSNYTEVCGLTNEQNEAYLSTKQHLLDMIDKFEDDLPSTVVFEHFTQLQQICCGFVRPKGEDEIIELGSHKISAIEEIPYNEGQTLFFCKYLFEVDMIIDWLGEELCARFTGQNRKTRDSEKELFTKKQKKYFVATMGSGGTGLNGLQSCQRIIFVSNSFKYSERKQCIGRIDRQGQEEEMQIYDIITNTGMDRRIQDNLHRKGSLANEIQELMYDKTKLKNYAENL